MNSNVYPYSYFQGKVVKIEDAKVSIMTNALQYGTAVFDGIRGYYSAEKNSVNIFRLQDHYKRFLTSVNVLGCKLSLDQKGLTEITLKLVEKNKPGTNIYLRPFAYVGNTNLGPNLANTILDFALYMIPLGEYLPVDKGLNVCVSSWRRINENTIPPRAKISGGYINSALARQEAAVNGYDEAIMLNDKGYVCEGSAENIFLVRDGTLITPDVADDILEGITRRSVIQIARDLDIPIEIRSVARSELYTADEVFFSGTGVQVAWVSQIDKRPVAAGKKGQITSLLQEKFFNIARGLDEKYNKWYAKVKIK